MVVKSVKLRFFQLFQVQVFPASVYGKLNSSQKTRILKKLTWVFTSDLHNQKDHNYSKSHHKLLFTKFTQQLLTDPDSVAGTEPDI